MRSTAAGRSAWRYDGLVLALLASVPGVLLPWLLHWFLLPSFEQASAPLPALTETWLAWFPLVFLLPLLVLAVWYALRARPRRDSIALVIAAAGSVLADAASIVAVWQLVVGAPGMV